MILGEVGSAEALVRAVTQLRAMGYRELDAFAPYEIEGLDAALGLPRSRVARWTLAGGITGFVTAYVGQWWISAVAWPLDVGGRPLHSAPAFIPVTFELTVLCAALATVAALFVKGRMGRLYEPVDALEAVGEGFWVVIHGTDPFLDPRTGEQHLRRVGASTVKEVP